MYVEYSPETTTVDKEGILFQHESERVRKGVREDLCNDQVVSCQEDKRTLCVYLPNSRELTYVTRGFTVAKRKRPILCCAVLEVQRSISSTAKVSSCSKEETRRDITELNQQQHQLYDHAGHQYIALSNISLFS